MGLKKRLLIALLASFLLSCHSFADELPAQEWSPYSGISGISIEKGSLLLGSVSQMPLIQSKDNLFINARIFNALEVKMASPVSYGTARLFFKRIGDKDYSMMNSFEFQTRMDRRSHTYVIDLSRNPNWYGVITRLMFSPGNEEGRYRIDGIKLSQAGVLLGLKASLQDFTSFDMPQLRTANFIYSPKWNGTPMNMIFYYAILFFSLLIVAYEAFKTRGLKKIYDSSFSKIIIVCLVFWMMFDIRMLFDQARSVMLDLKTYSGKTLEEKDALTTLGDFYGYIQFCDSKVPKGSSFDMVFPTYYYFDLKAVYYLYPTYYDKRSNVALVYDPGGMINDRVNEYYKKGFKLFAKYKEGEFILKK